MTINRREFLKLTGTTAACTCVAGLLGASGCAGNKGISDTPSAPEGSFRREGDKVIVTLSEAGDLEKVGSAVKFTLNDQDGSHLKIIVIHTKDAGYQAFADQCTHNGKELNYSHKEGILACCGLGSEFDLGGNVVKGPAEDALLEYPLQREGEELLIETQ
jgi:Rieske Fe-S protein